MKDFLHNTWKHRAHVVLALPVFLVLFFIMYVPMTGLVLAFKNFDVTKGIYGSPWCGLDNFKFLIASKNIFITMTRNTLMYYVIFTALGTFLNVTLAVAIDQCIFKKTTKAMQTLMIIPVFISYAAVQFIVYAFISKDTGLINSALGTSTSFYTQAKYWPAIVTITKIWKDTGYGSVLYMSVLAGIDTELYEAAEIDGANRWKKIWHITLPGIKPTIVVLLIMSLGNILGGGFDRPFAFQNNLVMRVADVIATFVYRVGIKGLQFSLTTAVGLFQSVVGVFFLLMANWISRKLGERGIW